MPEDTKHHHDEDLTTSTRERWEYIGTILAAVMLFSLPTLLLGTAAGFFTISGIGQAWFGLYAVITLMAATWAFGKETLEAVHKARGGK
jgi:hypothetical protein